MLITCCKSKELERDKEETKREFRGNSDDLQHVISTKAQTEKGRKPEKVYLSLFYFILFIYLFLDQSSIA